MNIEFSNLDFASPGFSLANARICLQAAADAYLNAECGARSAESGAQPAEFRISDSSTDTHVLLRQFGPALIVAFRGSASLRNWLTDFDAHKQAIATSHVHEGFYRAALSVRDELRDAIAKSNADTVCFTGHSLGGALAVVMAWLLGEGRDGRLPSLNSESEISGTATRHPSPASIHSVYTFGQPRVGDAAFARDAGGLGCVNAPTSHGSDAALPSTLAARLFRVTNRADVVPWVPGYVMGYRHFGNHIHLDALGLHENFPMTAELLVNGLEIYREFRRGELALLADHAVASYQEALR